jgi:hypothetical protein
MAAEIIQIDTQAFSPQEYGGQDLNLLTSFDVNTFLSSSSYIELYIYDNNQNILSTDLNFIDYTILNDGQSAGNEGNISEIILDPEQVLLDNGYDQGEYITYFNFFNHQIGSDIELLYIAEISSDRTEIRLDSTSLTNLDIVEKTTSFIQLRENNPYFLDFYLNFGDNQLSIANNIQLDNTDPNNPTILIKLYDALPEDFDLNSTLWVVTSVEEPRAYKVTFENIPILISDTISIQGPNFNLNLKDQVNNSTLSFSYTDLISTSLTSSQNQLNSLLEEKEIDINIDYTNFSDFIHFSSAQTRLENFYHKVELLEQYSSSISLLNSTNSSSLNVSSSKDIYENKINEIITNFDGWDYYLYYSSGSWAYPKLNTEPPYQLASTTSNTVLTWLGSTNESNSLYGGIILSASLFDNQNKDNLLFSIPEYLRDDSDNQPYELFIDMVAQHFDNIWIYYKDVTQKYNADNRLESGISKDIVADAIRDFGIKLYQNNFSNEDLYTAFLGLTPEGGLFPFPNITGSLPTPSGFEYVNTLISASNDYLPLDDVNKSLYKRIYHNLPYLLKAKGTLPGLHALITSYGIPDTILRINEYGGKDKSNLNDWDYWQDEFNYAFSPSGSNFIISPWELNADWGAINNVPGAVMLRFKLDTPNPLQGSPNQILFTDPSTKHKLSISYTGSGYTSGSYNGSIIDPYYQYATLTYTPDNSLPNLTASVYLPFYNEGWWSVLLNASTDISNPTDVTFTLHAADKIYEGGDNGTLLGFIATSSVFDNSGTWSTGFSQAYFGSTTTGSLQEIRYYANPISESVFKDYVMNPYSIEGNSLNSGPNELAFRLPLGGELYTGSKSIHPKITGSWTPTSSFVVHSSASFNPSSSFLPNTEYFFYDQPAVGIKNAVSDKIRLENNVIPSGNTLSPYRSLAQTTEASASYTPNTNLLEVAFSPQDEINDDINSSLGYFNIGDFIGDPAFRSSRLTSYPNLDVLRNSYFEKYTKNYDLVDFIRLIKFFDNSLFKMIKDFVPARTSLASGIIVKQTLLERNRYPQPQMDWENLDISGTLKPQWNDYEPGTVENFEGGTGGSFEQYNYVGNISQSWYETYPTPSGSVTILHNNQDEFYDGEFSGSVILVTTQSLNQAYPLELKEFEYSPILYKNSFYEVNSTSTTTQNQFLNSLTVPQQGEMLILAPKTNRITLTNPSGGKSSAYVKLHKTDLNGNNNTIPLGQINNLLIKYVSNSTYTNYQVLNTSEYSNYYLYEISNQNIDISGSGIDTEIKNYKISGSITSNIIFPAGTTLTGSIKFTSSLDVQNSYNSSSGYISYSNTPNVLLKFTASVTLKNTSGPNSIASFNFTDTNGNVYQSNPFSVPITPTTFTFTGSFLSLPGQNNYIYAVVPTGTAITMSNFQIVVTQSVAPTSSYQDLIIFEPYITTPNYYNSDNNPLINNAVDERQGTVYQDIDYSQGALVPVNFDLLIDGTATKATVQDSNYTLARHIIPRYDGSKSTSQQLNIWTEGDTGTYGKTPTIELNKVFVGYADTIGGYSPERMGSSGIIIKYLIDQNGDIHVPNVSENSLYDTQGTFVTNELMSISNPSSNQGDPNLLRKIIRGGQRIEPILYNQSGSMPGGTFVNSITLTDKSEPGGIISDFQTNVKPSTYQDMGGNGWNEVQMPTIVSSGSASDLTLIGGNYRYAITSDMISEGINITLNAQLKITNNNTFTSTAFAQFKNETSGVFLGTPVGVNGTGYIAAGYQNYNMNFSFTIPFGDLVIGDEYSIEVNSGHTNVFYESTSRFIVTQSPTPSSAVSTVGLWVRAGDNTLTTTNSTLIDYFNTNNIYQEDIANSGFFSIKIPWGLQPGDEFRFEGREDRVWMVEEVGVSSSPPLLVIRVDNYLPSTGVDYNQFLIRRYVDDASAIIFEGSKPGNTDGPYIIKPQYLNPELNAKIDKYITDLTNKGLL